MLVKYFAYYRDITGCKHEQVPEHTTVGELLAWLCKRYGSDMRNKLLSPSGLELGPDAIVLINGRNIQHLGCLAAPLSEHNVVSIFPIVAGG